MRPLIKAFFVILTLSLALSACVHKIDVQQGNLITNDSLSKIHVGMRTADIIALLGEPLVSNIYQDNEMLYVYTMKAGHHRMVRRNLTIYFVNDQVVHYTFEKA